MNDSLTSRQQQALELLKVGPSNLFCLTLNERVELLEKGLIVRINQGLFEHPLYELK